MNPPSSTGGGEGAGKARSFEALRHPGCRAYLIGTMLAMMADNIEHVISYWIIYQKFQSPALAGFAVISHWAPFLFFSVYAGALADRFDPRRIIQLGMVLFMVASAGWGYLFMTDSLEQWHAVVLLVIHGMAGVLWGPAAQLIIHDIVGRTHLQSAIRMMSTARQMGLLMGPAVGAGFLLLMGPAWGILFNALFYLPLTLWLVNAPYGPKFRDKEAAPPRPRAVRGFNDIFATIKMIAGNTIIVSMTLLAGVASLIVGNAHQAQMPEFAHDLGHTNAGIHYSVLLTAGAAGALASGVILESRNLLAANPRTAFILVMLWCLVIGVFAITDIYIVAVSAIFAAGFLHLAYGSMIQTLVQLHAPENIRGRVIGLYNMSAHGLRTFSGVTVGIGGSLIGIHWSLAISALALLTVTITMVSLTSWAARAKETGAGAE
jgi:MFS family permease